MSEKSPPMIRRTDEAEPDSLTLTITDALAEARGVEPTALPPLNDYVDVDTLTRLLNDTSPKQQRSFCCVTLHIEGEEVRVYDNGKVEVRPLELRQQSDSTRVSATGNSPTDSQ
jgi:hypothetical protein